MKKGRLVQILAAAGALLGVALLLTGSQCLFPPKPLIFNIWHTEADPGCQKQLENLRVALQRHINENKSSEQAPVQIRIQYVPWGQLSMKLSAVMNTPDQPDVTHLEPFMTASFYESGDLLPMDDLISKLQQQEGPILPSVLELQKYGNSTYGLAYAVGTTFYSYRKDWLKAAGIDLENNPPQTWDDMLELLPRMREVARQKNASGVLILPGGDPFFLDQFFGEVLSSLGGTLFTRTNGSDFEPRFDSDEVLRALKVLHGLSPYLVSTWDTVGYLDQFILFSKGKGLWVPVTYGRATSILSREYPAEDNAQADDSIFGVFPQPGDRPGQGRGTIDCEDWVIFRRNNVPPQEQFRRREIADQFLIEFFSGDNYLKFTTAVPVHLTPIFERMADRKSGRYWQDPKVKEWLVSWSSWADQSQKMLSEKHKVNPILMSRLEDNQNPYLYECQKARIITDMLRVALDPKNKEDDLKKAQASAQRRAVELVAHIREQQRPGQP